MWTLGRTWLLFLPLRPTPAGVRAAGVDEELTGDSCPVGPAFFDCRGELDAAATPLGLRGGLSCC